MRKFGKPLNWLDRLERAKRPARVPSVLTPGEAQRLLAGLDGMRCIASRFEMPSVEW